MIPLKLKSERSHSGRAKGHQSLKRTLAFLTASLTLVAAIVAVAMFWVRNSQTRVVYEGPVLTELWGTHGIHELDLVILAVEAVLVTLLVAVLVAGFSRRP